MPSLFSSLVLPSMLFWWQVVAGLSSLSEICNSTFITDALPVDAYTGIEIDKTSLIVNQLDNFTVNSGGAYNICNITFSYTHVGRDDTFQVNYWLPDPAAFRNRFLATGGGALMINGGASGPSDGPVYGAVSGRTDGGFGSFFTEYDTDGVDLLANGTLNYDTLFSFGYLAIHEMSVLGKALTRSAMQMDATAKLYSYYEGCSEGGREGWSQIQKFGGEWDGAAIGAPALRYSFQQVNHLFSGVAMQTLGYTPMPCELDTIVNATIAACDAFDGRIDGVVSRTDLCKLHFDMSSIIGTAFYCEAEPSYAGGPEGSPHGAEPAQNGTVSAEAIAVARTILDGLHDLSGKRVYLSYQPSATFADATPQYNDTIDAWAPPVDGVGGLFVARLLQQLELSALPTIEGVTYDTLRDWMVLGYQMFQDTLQVNWPDLTDFYANGGKIVHYHGESDNSIPPASSVRYWDSVRKIMYPGMSLHQSAEALGEWYRLYLVPGAGHCSSNTLQPDGPYPDAPLAAVIAWVEDGIKPVMLNATATSGAYAGEQPLCAFPLRPLFVDDGETMICEYDPDSLDTWFFDFDSILMPVY
ncbi:Tannase/feruloyl esterase [Limtongia smithiae]|uniref:Tannase/feruloyl esterase n=1 Tax=Limtongia smithiae TaxID=1125753 RepID=UPI0034CD1A61